MNINFRQSQFELFPGTSGREQEAQKPRLLFADLTLSLENIIVFVIVFMMLVLFSYSWGVERGKRLVKGEGQKLREEKVLSTPGAPKEHKLLSGASLAKATASSLPSKQVVKNSRGGGKENLGKVVTDLQEPVLKNFYTLQIASYKLQKNAQEQADMLKQKGYDAFVVIKGSHTIICIGRFSGMTEAKVFQNQFQAKHKVYKDSLIRRL